MTDTTSGSRSLNIKRRTLLVSGGAASIAALTMASQAIAAPPQPTVGEEPLTPAQTAAREAGAAAPPPPSSPEHLIEAWASTLAVQAATYAAPIVAMYNLRSTVSVGPGAKAPPGQIWRFMEIASPKIAAESGYVTPNVNVIYGFGFADLREEPYILTAPDSGGRYYMIEIVDMWTNTFAYPAGAKSGYKGGKFALVGPGWTGALPDGVTRIDCPTRWIELQPRVYVKDNPDLPAAQNVMNAIKLQPLSTFNGTTAPAQPTYDYAVPRVNPKVASSQMQFDDPLQFWSIFVSAMNENPAPEAQINDVLPQYRWLGIEFGKPWNAKNVKPVFLAAMKQASATIGAMMNVAAGPLYGAIKGGWGIPPGDVGLPGADYLTRAGIAVLGLTARRFITEGSLSRPVRRSPAKTAARSRGRRVRSTPTSSHPASGRSRCMTPSQSIRSPIPSIAISWVATTRSRRTRTDLLRCTCSTRTPGRTRNRTGCRHLRGLSICSCAIMLRHRGLSQHWRIRRPFRRHHP